MSAEAFVRAVIADIRGETKVERGKLDDIVGKKCEQRGNN